MTLFEAAKSVPAIDVAERYAGVKTVRKGKTAWCSCPFHPDKDPSLKFDLEGTFYGKFYCFSCHRNGTSVTFVQQFFNESFTDAAKRICADYGLEYEAAGADVREKARKKAAVKKLSDEISEALAFASCVASGIIRESQDKINQILDEDPGAEYDRSCLGELIKDATEFKDAITTPKDAKTAYALLTAEGVKDKLETQYKRLKKVDELTGTNYVTWYKRGAL